MNTPAPKPIATIENRDGLTMLKFEECDFWLDIGSVQMGPEIGRGNFSTVVRNQILQSIITVPTYQIEILFPY
jgi:hypothetical protein